MDFELQSFLQEMKRELRDDNNRIENKIDSCLNMVSDHETRVTVIEQTPPGEHEARLIRVEGFVKNSRWFVGTVIVGGVTAFIGWITTLFQGVTK